MLAQRIVTAIIGIIASIFVIDYGQWLFAGATTLLSLIAWHEFVMMMRQKNILISYWPGLIGIALLLTCFWLGNSYEVTIVFFIIIMAVLGQMVITYQRFKLYDAAFTLFGICYVGVPFIYFLVLRFADPSTSIAVPWGTVPAGAAYLWLAFIGTWASDTFAFFVGSVLGKNKLCPAVSPQKTVEGVIGGLAGSIVGVMIAGYVFHIPHIHSFALGVLIGIFAPLGDLVESVIKRFAGVKDSGRFFPGHGGVLDRFDSIMFTVPVVYYYVMIFLLNRM